MEDTELVKRARLFGIDDKTSFLIQKKRNDQEIPEIISIALPEGYRLATKLKTKHGDRDSGSHFLSSPE